MTPIPPSDRDRRVMFALDFRDPVTGLGVADLDVKAEGLGPPIRPPSGRFVWLDFNPPTKRNVRVTAKSRKQYRFADFDKVIPVPARGPDTKPDDLFFSYPLTPEGLYEPPDGLTGAAGWLIEAVAGASVKGAEVSLGFRHAGTQDFPSAYKAVTDIYGRFVAVANDLGDVRPDPAPPDPLRPGIDTGALGWLAVTWAGQTRYSGFQPLRGGRLVRFAEPFIWATLNATPP
jgi:hypothetical protein